MAAALAAEVQLAEHQDMPSGTWAGQLLSALSAAAPISGTQAHAAPTANSQLQLLPKESTLLIVAAMHRQQQLGEKPGNPSCSPQA